MLKPTVRGDTLAVHTFACGRCHKPSQQAGRGYRLILGARVQVCAACKAVIDRRRSACVAPARDTARAAPRAPASSAEPTSPATAPAPDPAAAPAR